MTETCTLGFSRGTAEPHLALEVRHVFTHRGVACPLRIEVKECEHAVDVDDAHLAEGAVEGQLLGAAAQHVRGVQGQVGEAVAVDNATGTADLGVVQSPLQPILREVGSGYCNLAD